MIWHKSHRSWHSIRPILLSAVLLPSGQGVHLNFAEIDYFGVDVSPCSLHAATAMARCDISVVPNATTCPAAVLSESPLTLPPRVYGVAVSTLLGSTTGVYVNVSVPVDSPLELASLPNGTMPEWGAPVSLYFDSGNWLYLQHIILRGKDDASVQAGGVHPQQAVHFAVNAVSSSAEDAAAYAALSGSDTGNLPAHLPLFTVVDDELPALYVSNTSVEVSPEGTGISMVAGYCNARGGLAEGDCIGEGDWGIC